MTHRGSCRLDRARRATDSLAGSRWSYHASMNFDFSELDRSIERTDYDAMAAAMSRAQRAQQEQNDVTAR